MKKNIFQFLALLSVLYFLNLMGRMYGLYMNFIATAILNFTITFYLLKINPFKKVGLSLLFFPSFLLSVGIIYGVVNNLVMPGLIGYIMYVCSTLGGIILYRSHQKIKVTVVYALFLAVAIANYYNMLNFYYSKAHANEIVGRELPEIWVSDIQGAKHEIKSDNKIKVIDLWSNSCANCIASFPKFEKIKNDYKNDPSVEFLSINIYQNNKDITRAESFLEGYTFNNYYSDISLYKKLNFNAVPYYVVLGKNNKIKYFGNLNMETTEIYNNMYTLIEKEKQVIDLN